MIHEVVRTPVGDTEPWLRMSPVGGWARLPDEDGLHVFGAETLPLTLKWE